MGWMKKSLLLIALVLFGASIGYSATVYSENFDGNTTLNGWTVSSTSYAERYTGTFKIGTAALRIRYNANAVCTVDTTGFQSLSITAKITAYSLESGEIAYFQYNTGSAWVNIGSVTDGGDSGTYKTISATLPASANNNANLQIRYIITSSSTADYAYIDEIVVTGTASTTTTPVSTETWTSEAASYTSPGHPSDYPSSQDVTTTITKSGATKIRVHFSEFATESGYDFVYILNGSGTQIAKYDGSKGAFTSAEVTGDTLKVRFTSDGSVVQAGFKIDKVEYVGTATGGDDPVVDPPAGTSTTIFEDTFASATLGSSWSTSGVGNYRMRVTTSYTPVSSYHVAMDTYPSGSYSTAQLILNKDLTGYKNIKVEYSYKESGDENHTSDGLYIYNGAWVQVKSFNNGPSTHTLQTVDLSAYSGITKIKWQQYDNYGMTSDGICIDNVKVTGEATSGGTTGPVASTHGGMGAVPYSGGVSFRVWAPNATSMAVAGEFNSWSATANALASEGNGYWSTDVAGASVGQKYKVVINGTSWKKDPFSRKQVHSTEASVIHSISTPSGIGLPYFEDQIIYQLHVGSFYRSASSGVGTFYDVATKAQYIKDLGVNMVEVLPIMEFAGDNSWGYNPCDIFAPESSYGGPEGLSHLVSALHSKGVGLILDLVYNHFGPSDMDLWQFDGWSENSGGGIYFYNDWRAETPWGHTRPDYGRGEVRQFLRDNAISWLTDYNVDGLRWDSTINIRKHNYTTDLPDGWTLLQYINNEINATKGSAISIAEDLATDAWVTYDTGSGGAGFDSQWDAGFVHPVKGAIEAPWDSERDMGAVAGALAVKYGDRTKQLIYVSSHDEVGNGKSRPPSAIDNGNPGSWFAKKRSTLGTGILMTAPGIPMIFQGEEWCQPGYFANSVFDNFIDWNLASAHSGIVQMYKDLITARKNYASLRGNDINVFHVDNANKVIAFHRWSGSQNMVIIANFADKTWNGNYEIGWPVWKTGHCVFNGDWNGYDAGFGNFAGWDMNPTSGGIDGMGQKASISIAPYTVQIYDLY